MFDSQKLGIQALPNFKTILALQILLPTSIAPDEVGSSPRKLVLNNKNSQLQCTMFCFSRLLECFSKFDIK